MGNSRRKRGYPESFETHYDWVRREAELTGEWADRDHWVEYIDGQRPDDSDLSDEQWAKLRNEQIDRRFDGYVSNEEIAHRSELAHRGLLEHIDDELIREYAAELEDDEVAENKQLSNPHEPS